MNCMWCDSTEAESLNTVYWELPDGTKAIEIQETPCVLLFLMWYGLSIRSNSEKK